MPNGRTKTPASTNRHFKRVEVLDAIEFDDADRAFHPHVAHMRQRERRFEIAGKHRLDGRHLRKPRLGFEEIEGRIGGGAGERIGHEGRAMHQRMAGLVRKKGVKHFFRGDGRAKPDRPAGQAPSRA